ncbi:hypothetical protein DFH28DRAFT_1087534 [Melampsora americana]|nr:hypothetical protein DFH28DRAFT_1087534 [Melampsora americana]
MSSSRLSAGEGRVDLMSRAIKTCSYKQALMGQRATSSTRNFQVTFNFWQLQIPPSEATKSKRRKKTPGGERPSKMKATAPKYKNYNPKVPINMSINKPANLSFAGFKDKLFRACDQKRPWVSDSLSKAWFAKAVDIQGFIHGSRKHKPKKMVISDLDSLREFMAATQIVPASTPMGFKIHHENPKITANASRFAQSLHRGQGPGGAGANNPPSEETDGDPRSEDLVGSDILSPGERKLRILMERFSKDFKRGENVTTVLNPQDPSLCMLLNTSRIRTWANDWADEVPGVDDFNPLTTRPGFRWIPVSNYEKEKNLLLGLGLTNPTDSSPSAGLGTVISSIRLLPPPSMPPFKEFLMFAGIKPEMTKTREILATQGIDQFSRLLDRKTYTFESFRSMGIPFAHADDLTKAVPDFIHHLKNLAAQNVRGLSE